jgi:4-hydroxy-tetrahydrodipicolinate synthase
MHPHPALRGVFVAAVTPLKNDLTPDLDAVPTLLDFFARRGAHGALLLGTTGEGPSFSPDERTAILQAAAGVRSTHPDFILLAGTGTPSLEETIALNRAAFDLGYDAVVVLPPYYFRNATSEGLLAWFRQVIERSIPSDGLLLGYHFPRVSGVPLTPDLLAWLAGEFPAQFGGIKDSSGDREHARAAAALLPDQSVLVGNDRLLRDALQAGGSGCITALANLVSPQLRQIYDRHLAGEASPDVQDQVDQARQVLDTLIPFPAAVKGLLKTLHGFPRWPVKPPLVSFPDEAIETAAQQLAAILED